jgi:phosphoribosyl 1,2-cyclic phosphodiesterase
MTAPLTVRFWGVRGSVPCPGPATVRYGGNTPCLEVRCGDRLIILDAGTGLRELGDKLAATGAPIDADIYLSHCHIDHINGVPFFAPFYSAANRFRIWAGNLPPDVTVESAVRTLMSYPVFPVGVEQFQAAIAFNDFRAGETLQPGPGVTLQTGPLNHPDGATGYRLEFGGRTLAYLTDNEFGSSDVDPGLVALARGADLLVYDTTYTDAEILSKKGWGHSTWREGLRLADAAGVKTFCLFHHAPDHDDITMDRIAREAQAIRPGTIAASEGLVIAL